MAQRGMWYPHTTPDINGYIAGCQKQFGVTTRVNWAATQFGGADFRASSNIIFSNGLLVRFAKYICICRVFFFIVSLFFE
jgi:hypothetical protein